MKKVLTIVLALLLTAALAISAAAAGELGMAFSASTTTLSRGESVTITVSVAGFADCKSGTVRVTYDEALFTRSDNKWLVDSPTVNEPNGDAVFAWSTPQKVSGNIYRFTLTAKQNATIKTSDVKVQLTLRNSSGAATSEVKTLQLTVACQHSYGAWTNKNGEVHVHTCSKCGTAETEKHKWEGTVTKVNGCDQPGEIIYECTVCGATKVETTEAGEHMWGSGEVTKYPSCSVPGVRTYTCASCGTTKTETISATGEHEYGVCKRVDYTQHARECKHCGAMEYKEHIWDDGVVNKEATCAQEGEREHTCLHCGASKWEPIAKLTAHTYGSVCDTTCSVCGYERETQHDYSERLSSDATGHWNACKNCGDILEKEPHNPGPEATETTDQICMDCGYVMVPAHSHTHTANGDLLSDEEAHWYQCECGEVIDQTSHTWDEGRKDAEAGTVTYLCTVCGYSRVEKLEEPRPTDPADPTDPVGTEPGATGNTEQPGHQGGAEEPGKTPGLAWWWYLVIVACVLLLGAVIFVIIGILMSRKQVGKYSSK